MSRWFTSNFFRYSFLIFIRVCALYNRFVSLHGAIKFIATSICPCLTSLKFLWSWLETAIISTITPCPSAIRFSIVLGCWSHSLCYLLFPKILYIYSVTTSIFSPLRHYPFLFILLDTIIAFEFFLDVVSMLFTCWNASITGWSPELYQS